MSVSTRTVSALLATVAAGVMTVAVTQSSWTDAAAAQLSSVGRADSSTSLDAVLGLTRLDGAETYREAGTYSAGSALTSVAGG